MVAISSRRQDLNLTQEVWTEEVTLEGISIAEILGITKFSQEVCTEGGEKTEGEIDIISSL